MRVVVAAVIERSDRRLLIGQRRRNDTSPLKWEFPGGKVQNGEEPVSALARELREELEIRFYAAAIAATDVIPKTFEKIAWVLPKELGDYDFLAANRELIAQLATGRIKPREILATKV